MKLIGSLAEQQMRNELLRSNLALQDGSHERLVPALALENVDIADAFVTPEQFEGIYSILVSEKEIVTGEVPRYGGEVLLARENRASYESKCSKVQKLKIAVAEALLASKGVNVSH